ncbi:D-ribitol-5-phosphate cytidylyltransferase-like [Lytechinus variegatus]|uniref:D-ribitol-5-phosphate cytidylyltransferase-like n=1 Tax=Lytechinus variegatus TaxID=7654 RepID=UPI001BB2D02B|nr:D-ribitol-5-phosphate cytidylyltransferase-like [Lytechinus variegatus]
MRVIAILPAAGTGERTGLKTPKQFCEIAGFPLILHTLWNFQRPWIAETVVAVSDDWLPSLQDLVTLHHLKNVQLLIGGKTRHQSIKICVQYVCERIQSQRYETSDVIIIVHDAVRPFVAEETLQRVTEAAHKQGAAGVVCPLVSTTLATKEDGILDYSLVRSKHCNSHTPQAFSYETIVTAYDKISQHDLDHGTEVLHLALEYAGVRAKLLHTTDEVWKVTYRRDMCAAEQFARERLARVAILSDGASLEIGDVLEEKVKKRRLRILSKCSSVTTLPSDINSVIVIADTPPITECMLDVTTVLEKLQQQCPLKGSVILLVTMPAEEKNLRDNLMERFKELRLDKRYRDVCVYCVILETKSLAVGAERIDRVCELTANLVLRQDELMSGQTFIV